MKIESIIRRKNGTKVRMDNENYHFKPTGNDPRHLAEVNREAHVAAFLRIPEGFRLPDGEEIDPKLEKDIEQSLTLKGSVIHDPIYPIGGNDITLEEIIVMAFEDAAIGRDEWNALEDQDRYEFIDRTIEDLRRDAATAPVEPKPVVDEKAPERDPAVDPEAEPKGEPEPQEEAKEEPAPAELNRDALAKEYQAKLGKKPHHSLSAERIKQILDDL